MASIAFTAELVTDTCITCGCEFAMPQALQLQRRRDHAWFYCPNGHAQQYSGKSEAEKLRDQLVAMQAQRDRERATVQRLSDESATAERKLSAAKGQITKLKNRAAKGICPCCNEQFPDLHQHMQTAHPDYESQADESETAPETSPTDE